MPWKPDSWVEFRQTYRAGNCHVEFFHNTMDWASRNNWKLKPDLRRKRGNAVKGLLALSFIMIVVTLAAEWSYLVPLIGVPLAALAAYGEATTPGHKDWERAFIQKMLDSEQAFWDAWGGSGIDLYRRGADGKFPHER